MSKHEIKFKKLDRNAQKPTQANQHDAGHDMYALDDGELAIREIYHDKMYGFTSGRIMYIQYRTGIAIEPPEGYHTELFPRSSVSKKDLMLANSIGLVDEGYRNEIVFRFKPILDSYDVIWGPGKEYEFDWEILQGLRIRHDFYKKGDRIGQLVLRKTEHYNLVEAEELSDSERGLGGLGSSGA